MKKKILIFGVLSVLMLVTISFSSAISANSEKDDKRESPLFKLRTQRALSIKLGNILEQIKTKFLGERIYMIPFSLMKLFDEKSDNVQLISWVYTSCKGFMCGTIGLVCK